MPDTTVFLIAHFYPRKLRSVGSGAPDCSDYAAHLSTRNTVSCMAQGEAVGAAAALCASIMLITGLDVQMLRALRSGRIPWMMSFLSFMA